MNTRMFPELPREDQERYDKDWDDTMEQIDKEVEQELLRIKTRDIGEIYDFVDSMAGLTEGSLGVVRKAWHYINKSGYVPDSVKDMMVAIFEKSSRGIDRKVYGGYDGS